MMLAVSFSVMKTTVFHVDVKLLGGYSSFFFFFFSFCFEVVDFVLVDNACVKM